MQGFAFKVTIVTAALFSATFSISSAFAANRMSATAVSHHSSVNKSEALYAAAGCMGCHMGETLGMSSDELTVANESNQSDEEMKYSSQKSKK